MKTIIEINESKEGGWEARFVRKPFKQVGKAKKPREAVVDLFSKLHNRAVNQRKDMTLSEQNFVDAWLT